MKRTWTTHRDGPDMPLHGAGAELWSRLEDFAGDAAPSRAVTLRLKRRAALALSAAGVALALVFAGINVLRGLPSTAGWEVAAAVLLAANFHYLVRGGRLARATLAGLIVVVPTLLVGALSVGLPALCWLYALPLVAFFLLGLRAGTVANLVLAAVYLVFLAAAALPLPMAPYARLDLALSYVLVAGFAWLYERTRQRTERELIRLSWTDELTGAMNRRRFAETLGYELEKARRYRQPLALLMIDVDHFKRVNDSFGHECGDRVLRAAVGRMTRRLRQVDVFARYGGEEFCVLAPGTPLMPARAMAEKMRELVGKAPFPEAGRVTISVGVAELRPGDTADTFLARADRALYDAKWTGRNWVAAA